MVHFPRFVSKQIAGFLADDKVFRYATPSFLPFYHVVSAQKLPHILNYPYFTPEEFEQQLDVYLKYFKPVDLDYLVQNPNSKEKIFHLSFDDGLRECAEIVAPILLKKGIPATFFINSAFVDNQELFHRYKASLILDELKKHPCSQVESFLLQNGLNRENILQATYSKRDILDEAAEQLELHFALYLKKHRPYLSTKEVKELHRKGFTIGGHSHKHPEFWRISEKKQLKQVRKSMKWVNENINPKIKAFAFPYTDDAVSASFMHKLRHENICDITFGTAGLKFDEMESHYQRYPVEQIGDFKENLKAEIVYYKLRKAIGKETVSH